MNKEPRPKCGQNVYILFKKDGQTMCAYCTDNLWAINEERKRQAQNKEAEK